MRQDCTTCQSNTVWGLEKMPARTAAAAQARPRNNATSGRRVSPKNIRKLLISNRLIQPSVYATPRVSPQAWQNAAPGTYSALHSGQTVASPAGEG